MNELNSWKEKTNESLKERKSNLKVVNKFFYYFLKSYFWITLIVLLLLVCLVLIYLLPFVKQGYHFLINNHEGILNYFNSTI